MITMPAQEIKRRGIGAVDKWLAKGPVHIVRNNQPRYVVMSETDYAMMAEDLSVARVAASDEDLAAGRIGRGTADDLMAAMDVAE